MTIGSNMSILMLAILMMAGLAIATEENGEYTVNLVTNEDFGSYLVNETGFALYYYIDDPGNGTSICNDDCLESWPAFYAENITVPESLNASDFTEVVRTDGVKQTAYKGWPLYFYSKDTASGDFNGQGVNDVWFLLVPEEFVIIEV